jgi:hypothetical protein
MDFYNPKKTENSGYVQSVSNIKIPECLSAGSPLALVGVEHWQKILRIANNMEKSKCGPVWVEQNLTEIRLGQSEESSTNIAGLFLVQYTGLWL